MKNIVTDIQNKQKNAELCLMFVIKGMNKHKSSKISFSNLNQLQR